VVHLLGVQIDPPEPVCDKGQLQTERKKSRTLLVVVRAAMPLSPLNGEPDMFMRISEAINEHEGTSARKSGHTYGR